MGSSNIEYTFANGAIPVTTSRVTWTYSSSTGGSTNTGFAVDTQGGGVPSLSLTKSFHGPDISDSQNWVATATFVVDTPGTCRFWAYVQSESGYDYGRFYVDNVLQFSESGFYSSFTQRSYALTAGTHTLKWQYSKDGSASSGLDQWFIGEILLPNVLIPGPSFTPDPALGTGLAIPSYSSTFVIVNVPSPALGTGQAFGRPKVSFRPPVALGVGSTPTTAQPAGNNFTNPIILTPSGSRTISLLGATSEAGEPASTDPSTVWLKLTPTSPGIFSLTAGTSSYGVTIEQYDTDSGSTLTNLVAPNLGQGSPTNIGVAVAADRDYMFRLFPSVAGTARNAVALTYSFTVRDPTVLAFQTNNNVAWTPSSVNVSLSNASVNTQADFYIDGVFALSYTTDDLGNITNFDVPVGTLAAGTHSVSVVCSGITANANFEVLYGVLGGTDVFAGDAPPPTVTKDVVQYWRLYDPHVGGETYVFERNPAEMSSLIAPRPLSVETTTSFSGQAITWEGSRKPTTFRFSGTLDTQTQLEAFDRFVSLNRRIYLVDHNREAWIVTLEHLDAEPLIKPNKPWHHKYTITGYAFFGPVILP